MVDMYFFILISDIDYKDQRRPVWPMNSKTLPLRNSPPIYLGLVSFINQWDEAIKDVIYLKKKPNELMEKKLFK